MLLVSLWLLLVKLNAACVAVVAAVDAVVVNTARDTSWLLGKSNKVDVCVNKGVNQSSP